jgi:hypothetical protein
LPQQTAVADLEILVETGRDGTRAEDKLTKYFGPVVLDQVVLESISRDQQRLSIPGDMQRQVPDNTLLKVAVALYLQFSATPIGRADLPGGSGIGPSLTRISVSPLRGSDTWIGCPTAGQRMTWAGYPWASELHVAGGMGLRSALRLIPSFTAAAVQPAQKVGA